MSTLIIDLWIQDGDNIDFEVEVEEDTYNKVAELIEQDSSSDPSDFLTNEEYNSIAEQAEEEIKRSIEENCDEDEDWEEVYEDCSWGFRIKGIGNE